MHGICVELCGIRTVYARYTLVYAGSCVVYAWYTRGIRVELCGIRTVYARIRWYTLVVVVWYQQLKIGVFKGILCIPPACSVLTMPFIRKVQVFSLHATLVGVIPVCTAQGGSGSFKDRKPIGAVRCCESWMAEQIHWWIEKWLEAPQGVVVVVVVLVVAIYL